MQHDDVPLPTNKLRRRSLFDNDDENEVKETIKINVPEVKSEIYYPLEYIENVRTEIEQWEMHVTKALEEKQKLKNEKTVLQNTVFDENILSTEQLDFFTSLNFNEYMRRVKTFSNRVQILADKLQFKEDNDIERMCDVIKSKIENDVLENHFK